VKGIKWIPFENNAFKNNQTSLLKSSSLSIKSSHILYIFILL